MTLRIELSGRRGGFVLIDEQDQAFVQARRWYLAPTGYAMDSRGRLLHRELLGLQRGNGLYGDHINGDPLDNRRENLRVCTQAENAQNVKTTGGSSKYRGVCRDQSRKKWLAYCRMPGETGIRNLGRFASEEQAAAVARDFRAKHMPFANEERYG